MESMQNMKKIQMMAMLAVMALLASCNSMVPKQESASSGNGDSPKILFEDSMAKNWQKNWFLDGKKATLDHRDGGLAFITEYTVNKHEDRAGFDAQHAVLWTRQKFEGDIRISYNYTRLPGCSWQKLIYVQAQGVGEKPYVKDIYAWRDHRDVPVMSEYFNYMDLIGLSLRKPVRCKRYPWRDMDGNKLETEFRPRAENKGMPIGHELHVLVEKTKKAILLRIKDTETGEYVVDHTWDLTDEKVLKNRDPKFVEEGRIGLRHMGGFKAIYRDFKVERL